MNSWTEAIGAEKRQPYFQQILQQVRNERVAGKVVYPPQNQVFSAFALTEFKDVKVVILGQDPYHSQSGARFGVFGETARSASALAGEYV